MKLTSFDTGFQFRLNWMENKGNENGLYIFIASKFYFRTLLNCAVRGQVSLQRFVALTRFVCFAFYIGLGKKKCRICDWNLTLYLTYLELSDLNQICAVLFANLLPFRRQCHYSPLITPLLICKKLRQTVFASLFWGQLSITKSVLHGPGKMVITWCQVWTIRWVR